MSEKRAFGEERAAIAAVFTTAQSHLRVVFVCFLAGFLFSFYALRVYVWDRMAAMTESRMDPATAAAQEIVVQTPFDVVLLQAKIGIIAGLLVALPPSIYLARGELRTRGYWPRAPIAFRTLFALGTASSLLFAGGVAYAYWLFFPVLLDFLAANALSAGVDPTWSIVMWTEFLLVLSVSFGLAAQLPLAMAALAYADVVPYETFREKWRHAVLGIFVFGAVFSPPDPFSQFMWAVPLTILYGISLALTRVIVGVSRSTTSVDSTLHELEGVDAADVRAAPDATFAGLPEEEALAAARRAMDRDDPAAAEAILERFDDASGSGTVGALDRGGTVDEKGTGSVWLAGLRELATEVREDDDVGGYAYDLYAVAGALRSKLRRLVLVFGVVLLATFGVLYEGGFGLLAGQFFSRVPAAVRLEESELVALHPVEVLLFQMEISTLVAVLAVVPLIAYYAWPTLAERELVRSRRRTILVWTGALGATFVAATLVGYLYVAPALLSYLVSDALRAGLIVSYRIDRVAWLVVYTTVGFGALACVPVGMWLLNRIGTVSYRGYRENWREVAISVLVLSSLLSPGVLSMLLAATSTMLAYAVGLLGLWLLTLGGRFDVPIGQES
ncbi:twin-arginine translocase subunit TatC [Halalkalicoccus ordinarius]|uniref:twin-arginine translocase subunit TatC n=1 Tax=Halalkalicoccus ordinarius TaxID=3116651 RepID=UPI00300E9E1A